jgi:hypothetical protein
MNFFSELRHEPQARSSVVPFALLGNVRSLAAAFAPPGYASLDCLKRPAAFFVFLALSGYKRAARSYTHRAFVIPFMGFHRKSPDRHRGRYLLTYLN